MTSQVAPQTDETVQYSGLSDQGSGFGVQGSASEGELHSFNAATWGGLRRTAAHVTLALVALVGILRVPAAGQDVVHVANPSSDRGYAVWSGRVDDYTGRELRLLLPNGSQRTFPADQVLRIETQYGPQHVEADERFRGGEFDAALASYGEARKSEPRPWVRRQITAQIVWCYRALGQPEWAGREFLDVLLAGDPSTPYFACIPLAWAPSQPSLSLERTAQEWLQRDEMPAAVLLGASHLMSAALRAKALEKLNGLATNADERIRFLAVAQTWQAAVVTAEPRQIEAWRATIERMPEPLRAGPYYVLGSAEAQREQWEQAALAWLRIPILYPKERLLAARSLLEAGRSLEKLGQPERAAGLYREVVQTYPNTPSEVEARARLRESAGNED